MKQRALLFFTFLSTLGFAQERLTWNTFERLVFEEVYEPTQRAGFRYPYGQMNYENGTGNGSKSRAMLSR